MTDSLIGDVDEAECVPDLVRNRHQCEGTRHKIVIDEHLTE